MRRATGNSVTRSLDFAADDPAGLSTPGPDGAAAGAMRRATGNSVTKSLDFAVDDPAGLPVLEPEPSPDGAAAGTMSRATGNSGARSLDFAADDHAGVPTSELSPDYAAAGAMRRATGNSVTRSLDFAADDPAGLPASEPEPSPDGAAAGTMRRATGNSGTKRPDFASDDPAGLPEPEPSPDGTAAGTMRRASGNSVTKAVGIKRQFTYVGSYLFTGKMGEAGYLDSYEIVRFPEAPNGTQADLSSVGIADFFRYLNSYKFANSLARGKKRLQTYLSLSKPVMLLYQTDDCPDGGVECLQRSSTAGGSSAVRESCRSAGKRISGAALAERSVGGWPQEGLTLYRADGSNGLSGWSR